MKLFNELKNFDKKIIRITYVGLILCLLLALLSAMILSIYHNTYIIFQFDLGITLLKLSIIFFTGISIYSIAFNRILKDLN